MNTWNSLTHHAQIVRLRGELEVVPQLPL
jgi:hypothetical protein